MHAVQTKIAECSFDTTWILNFYTSLFDTRQFKQIIVIFASESSSTGSMHVSCVGCHFFPGATVPCTRKQLCRVRFVAKFFPWHHSDRIKESDSLPTPSSFAFHPSLKR